MKPLLITLLLSTFALVLHSSDQIRVLSKPAPTHEAKQFIELHSTSTIGPELDRGEFLTRASEIIILTTGNFIVWDNIQNRFFLFNTKNRLLKQFGTEGQGPGEYSPSNLIKNIFITPDQKINMTDYFSKKTLKFSLKGELLSEHKYGSQHNLHILFMLNTRNCFSLMTDNKLRTTIANYNIDEDKYNSQLIPNKDYKEFLFIAPTPDENLRLPGKMNHWASPTINNTKIEYIDSNRFILHQNCSSIIYIFNKNKIETRFPVRPQKLLSTLNIKLEKMIRKIGNNHFFIKAAPGFFVDYKNRNFFYLTTYHDKNGYGYIYKFNLKNQLIKAFKVKNCRRILAGTDGKFFSAEYDHIKLLEVKTK